MILPISALPLPYCHVLSLLFEFLFPPAFRATLAALPARPDVTGYLGHYYGITYILLSQA